MPKLRNYLQQKHCNSFKTLSYILVFMVVTQPHTIFRASVRINYRYILKLNKLTWLTSHRRREKELMIIIFSLFFVFALVLSSCWIWLKQKYFLHNLPPQQSTLQVFYPSRRCRFGDCWQDNVCKLWNWWRI